MNAIIVLLLVASAQAQVSFEERKLGELPAGAMKADDLEISPDGRCVTFVAKDGGKQYVVVGDTKLEAFDEVRWPGFAPDGQTVYYSARTGKKWRLVVGDRKSEEFDVVRSPAFSADGKSMSVIVRSDGKWHVVVDGRWGEAFDKIEISSSFSADGKSFLYRAQRDGKAFVVAGDKKIGPFDESSWAEFMSGDVLAYCAKSGEKEFVVVGDQRGEEFEYVMIPSLSPDRTRIAYVAWSDAGNCVVVDGKRQYELGKDRGRDVVFAPDGKSVVFTAMTGDRKQWYMVAGDRKLPAVEGWDASDPHVTPDGKHALCVLRDDKAMRLYVDGKVGPPFEVVRWPDFSPAGEATYVGTSGKGDKRQDTLMVGERALAPVGWIRTYRFSPDGATLAWMVDTGGRSVVHVGGTAHEFEAARRPIQFSADGKKVAFAIARGREIWWKVIEVR